MTIPATTRKAGPFLGTGAQTVFPFAFKVFSANDVAVTVADAAGVETELSSADYTVTLNVNQDTSPGGTVTYPRSGVALPVNSRLVITSGVDLDQPLDLPSGGNFSPLALENELDRIVMQIQQLAEQWTRALRVSVTSSGVVPAFPPPVANKLIAWNSGGTALTNADIADLSQQFVYADWRYETFTGDGVTRQFLLAGNPSTIANTDTSIDGLSQVPVDDFALDGNIVTFAVPPGVGAQILVRYGRTLSQSGGLQTITKQVATAGQTVFTLADSYPSNQSAIAAYVNGLRMEGAAVDFTETSDTTVTFTSPLAAGDSVIFVVGTEVTGSGPGVVSLATGNNVGAGAGLLFRDVTDDGIDRKLNIKTIAAGNGVTVTNGADTVQLAVNVGSGLSFDGSGKLVASTAAGVLNVKAAPFNAVGDGVTDDTAAIQAAFAGAVAQKRSLFFPAGIYMTTGLVFNYTFQASMIIYGEGRERTIIRHIAGQNNNLFTLANTESPSEIGPNGMLFKEMGFQGNYPNTFQVVSSGYTQNAFYMETAFVNAFEECKFSNAVFGLQNRKGVLNYYNRCVFQKNEYGFRWVHGHSTTSEMLHCDSKENYRVGIHLDDGRGFHMIGGSVEANGTVGLDSYGVFIGNKMGTGALENFLSRGASFDSVWFENNTGPSCIVFSGGINSLHDCIFAVQTSSPVIDIAGGQYHISNVVFEREVDTHIQEAALGTVRYGNTLRSTWVGGYSSKLPNIIVNTDKTRVEWLAGGGSTPTIEGNNTGTGTGFLYKGFRDEPGKRILDIKTLFASTGIGVTNTAETVNIAVLPATASVIGGVKPGAGLSVDAFGVLSATGGGGGAGAWQSAPLQAGWSVYTTADPRGLRYRLNGDVVELSGCIQYSSGTIPNINCATLPVGFRPTVGFKAQSIAAGEGTIGSVLIGNAGNIDINATSAIVFLDGVNFPIT